MCSPRLPPCAPRSARWRTQKPTSPPPAALAEQTGALFFEAERLRLLAAVLPADRSDEATALRMRALALAEEQGATVFGLRAALDLARAGAPDGVDHLAVAVARFPAGAGYAELNEAQALLTASASA